MAGADKPSKLYLVVESGPTAADRLAVALSAATPSTVLVTAPAGEALEAQAVLPLIALGQKAGVAVLLADDARLARVTKADGVHLAWSKDVVSRAAEAREILGTRFIVGADAGRSRHEAMQFGEQIADYVAFGIPDSVEDRAKAEERRLELIDWWSEIFEVPCVAFDVTELDDAAELADAGADFVAIRLPRAFSGADLVAFVKHADAAVSANAAAA